MSKTRPGLVFADALALMLEREYTLPVITQYELCVFIFRLLKAGQVDGRPLRARPRLATRSDLYVAKEGLLRRGTFKEDRSLPSTVFRILDKTRTDPAAVISAVDPFGFISHLSAMAFHGLSNRLPKVIFFTTLAHAAWRNLAEKKMQKDLGEDLLLYREQHLPDLNRVSMPRAQAMNITYVRSSLHGGFRFANDRTLRVATLGRTFLDMLRRPELCGGMQHVLEIFESRGQEHASLIISEIEQRGSPIDKVRAGYILESICGIEDERLAAWTIHAQRGGSRKLDPQSDYAPNFSERWQISINV